MRVFFSWKSCAGKSLTSFILPLLRFSHPFVFFGLAEFRVIVCECVVGFVLSPPFRSLCDDFLLCLHKNELDDACVQRFREAFSPVGGGGARGRVQRIGFRVWGLWPHVLCFLWQEKNGPPSLGHFSGMLGFVHFHFGISMSLMYGFS